MNQLLQTIEFDINDSKSFVSFIINIKISQNPIIASYDYEINKSNGTHGLDPP